MTTDAALVAENIGDGRGYTTGRAGLQLTMRELCAAFGQRTRGDPSAARRETLRAAAR